MWSVLRRVANVTGVMIALAAIGLIVRYATLFAAAAHGHAPLVG